MKWTRYEILLPLRYNDGRRIEHKKFRQTNPENIGEVRRLKHPATERKSMSRAERPRIEKRQY